MNKKKLAILYGGKSVEHDISIRSAKNIFTYADRTVFELICIGISREGSWYLTEGIKEDVSSGEFITVELSQSARLLLPDYTEIKPDVFFPILHGPNGEDGSIQGFLQVIDKPYVGSGILGSSVGMSKLVSKQLMMQNGIPTAKFLHFNYYQKDSISFEPIKKKLGLPFIVKAANLGSSIGINKVNNEKDFTFALEEAFRYDHTILIESFVEGRELECAVMGNKDIMASVPGEILVKGDYDFYTYQAKYFDDEAVSINIPAKVEEHILNEIKDVSKKCYLATNCKDFARIDLFLLKTGEILINEINTIPGFTDASMFPMMWKYEGIQFKELISRLIDYSLERHNLASKIKTTL